MEKEITFTERVQSVVRKIQKGETRSYKEVAISAGSPKAARAVGTIMAHNYLPDIPCHRVIKSDGTVGGYNHGGTAKKMVLLRQERITNK